MHLDSCRDTQLNRYRITEFYSYKVTLFNWKLSPKFGVAALKFGNGWPSFSELQSNRATELQSYRFTELQIYRETDLQSYRVTEFQSYRESE